MSKVVYGIASTWHLFDGEDWHRREEINGVFSSKEKAVEFMLSSNLTALLDIDPDHIESTDVDEDEGTGNPYIVFTFRGQAMIPHEKCFVAIQKLDYFE